MAFSDKLKELMNQKCMKAVDLARATGLSEAAISDYLKGKKEPRGRQSIAIAKALDVSLDTLWETDFHENEFQSNIKDTSTIGNCSYFSNSLKLLLKKRNMNKNDLCRLTGLSPAIISAYLQGKMLPSIPNLILIADVLDTSIDALIYENLPFKDDTAEINQIIAELSEEEKTFLLEIMHAYLQLKNNLPNNSD